jgi:hypothetical protein
MNENIKLVWMDGIVKVYEFILNYKINIENTDGEQEQVDITDYALNEKEKEQKIKQIEDNPDYVDGSLIIDKIDLTDYEFINNKEYKSLDKAYSALYAGAYEVLSTNAKQKRDELLVETDFTQLLDVKLTDDCKQEFKDYRQKIRDIVKQSTYPFEIAWPEKPAEVWISDN